ncbi:MAG: bifunctional UDP-sugar hydrolase/5'-nucleotidase [Bacteroidales bacterium]
MKFKNKLFFVLVISILFSGCYENKKPSEFTLKIIETSDVHGTIFNYDFILDTILNSSLSQVQSFVNQQIKEYEVILLDNGDILQGQPVVYYYNYQNTTDSHIVSRVYNYMQYDAMTIGNHDIEAGSKTYDKLVKEFNFPVLAANAVRKDNGKPYFKPYTVIERSGYKIAVLGLITPKIPEWLPEELWKDMEFLDMIETAQKWVPVIQKNENPDLLVGLFHAGFDYTYANSDETTYKNENASVLVAKKVPGFDIIFIGHDHHSWNEKVINSEGKEVHVLGPIDNAQQVTEAVISFKKSWFGKVSRNIETQIIPIKNYTTDSLFDKTFMNDYNEVKTYVSKPIGNFTYPLCSKDALFGPSDFMELIHTIQLEISKADVSIAASQSFNSCIDKGPVYIRDMFKLFRYENFLYTISLSGSEIKNYLEYSFGNWFNDMKTDKDYLMIYELDDNGNPILSEKSNAADLKNMFFNFDVAGGLKYSVDISKPKNQKITIFSLANGKKFHPDSIYTVALNSYRGNGGGGLLTYGAGINKEEIVKRRIQSTDVDLRFFAIQWIERNNIINTDFKPDWNIVPQSWWEKAVEKDKKLLNLNN